MAAKSSKRNRTRRRPQSTNQAVCDFCARPRVSWSYPARDAAIDPESDGILPPHASHGAWAACGPCHELIEADDRIGLAVRAADYFRHMHPDGRITTEHFRFLHEQFFDLRTGPAHPVKSNMPRGRTMGTGPSFERVELSDEFLEHWPQGLPLIGPVVNVVALLAVTSQVAIRGELPDDELWTEWVSTNEGMPSAEDLHALFGSWDKLFEWVGLSATLAADYTGMRESADRLVGAYSTLSQQLEERETAVARREEAVTQIREQAKEDRTAAGRAQAQVEGLASTLARRDGELAHANARIAELTANLTAALSTDHDPEGLLEHLAQLEADLVAERERGDALANSLRELTLATPNGTAPSVEPDGTDDEPEAPASVLEALAVAERKAKALKFTPRARQTAADSPFLYPERVVQALERLDALASEYEAGSIGDKLSVRARELGLHWKGGIADDTATRYRNQYRMTVNGVRLDTHAHIALDHGAGASKVCRIYFAVHPGDDRLPRGIYLGAVGRHLPDSTTA